MERSASDRVAVQQLGYIGVATAHLDAWTQLCEDVLDCEVVASADGSSALVRVDERQHRLVLRGADHDGLDFLGWEVAGPAELDRIAERLQTAGVTVAFAEEHVAAGRHVARIVRAQDPAGIALEIYHGPKTTENDFAARWPHSGYVTGELGIGHAVVATPQYAQTVEFYVNVLGMRVSDYVDHPAGWDATFLRCNARHHSLAVVRQPDVSQPVSLHHLMLECKTLDDVGLVLDKCLSSGIRITQSLGRHTNDHMVSFYLGTPSGFEIEYGALGRLVDEDNWQIVNYASPSIWGHLPREGFVIPSSDGAPVLTAQNAYTMGS